jgi:hypothetical protein
MKGINSTGAPLVHVPGWMGGWMDGWMDGWVGGSKSGFTDCLQQSKMTDLIQPHSFENLKLLCLVHNPHLGKILIFRKILGLR